MHRDWLAVIDRLGGAEHVTAGAKATRAFLRPRGVKTALDLLRLVLAYALGERGLRSVAVWASAVGLAAISNVALLYRLRRCGDWLALLIGQALAAVAPEASRGRMLRLADRAHWQPDRMARVLAAGGDILVRAGWRNAAWRDAKRTSRSISSRHCTRRQNAAGSIERS